MSSLGLAIVGVALTACGQKGSLYLPTDPAAKGRATLPQILTPGGQAGGQAGDEPPPASAPPAPASSNEPAKTEGAK